MSEENPYNRKLTPEEEVKIDNMMKANPVIDYLFAETLVKMPKDDLLEIFEKHKKGELKNDLPEPKEYVLKTGKVLEE
jgi:hypothetical protein